MPQAPNWSPVSLEIITGRSLCEWSFLNVLNSRRKMSRPLTQMCFRKTTDKEEHKQQDQQEEGDHLLQAVILSRKSNYEISQAAHR